MQFRNRLPYFLLMLFLVPIGLGSREFDADLPYLYGTYAPDVLWATMFYLGFRFLNPQRPMVLSIISSLISSYLIELSQFYHAPWIDAIRATWLGGLLLGFSFLWSDLVCYTLGIFLGYAIDRWWIQKKTFEQAPRYEIISLEE